MTPSALSPDPLCVDPMTWLDMRVLSKRREADDIFSFVLAPVQEDDALAPYQAGAHVSVKAGAWVRQYSLCPGPEDGAALAIAVHRDSQGRGGSQFFCDSIDEGDVIAVSAPVNHFPLVQAEAPPILLAGGIGITPLLSMAYALTQAGRSFDLHYLGRRRSRMAFLDTLATLCPHRTHVHIEDERDTPLELATLIGQPAQGRHLYVCGPPGMIDAVQECALHLGWPPHHIHFERFSANAPAAAGDRAFEVVIASSGQCVNVPAGTSAAQALKAAGVDIPVSCEQGLCGLCMTGLLQGRPDHRDAVLTPQEIAEGRLFLPCCSRALDARLVLDL